MGRQDRPTARLCVASAAGICPGPSGLCGAPIPVAFPLRDGGKKARHRRRIAKCAELAGELPPYRLVDVAGIGVV